MIRINEEDWIDLKALAVYDKYILMWIDKMEEAEKLRNIKGEKVSFFSECIIDGKRVKRKITGQKFGDFCLHAGVDERVIKCVSHIGTGHQVVMFNTPKQAKKFARLVRSIPLDVSNPDELEKHSETINKLRDLKFDVLNNKI